MALKHNDLSWSIIGFLKPKAFEVFSEIGTYVHYHGDWYRHWKNNIFFTIESNQSDELIRDHEKIMKNMKDERMFRYERTKYDKICEKLMRDIPQISDNG